MVPFTNEFLLPHEAKEAGLDYDALPTGKYPAHLGLKDTLLAEEASGILAWFVRGAVAWQGRRTDPPDSVRAAVQAYRKEEDLIGRFFEESCAFVKGSVAWTASEDLRRALRLYVQDAGGNWAPSDRELAQALRDRGCTEKRKGGGRRGWSGVLLSAVDADAAGDEDVV